MKFPRRSTLLAGAALLASCSKKRPMAQTTYRPLTSLPTTTLSWLTLRDHFVATVGPNSGQGQPMGSLLVLADATFTAHSRFPLHSHQEMEILSIVLDGSLSHHGDQAHGATVPARSAQLISARDGMVHAEGNDTEGPVRMLQIWFRPTSHGGPPAYYERSVARGPRQMVAGDAVMPLRCDAKVWWIDFDAGQTQAVEIAPGRKGYLLALDTTLSSPAGTLAVGEGLMVNEGELQVTAAKAGAALWIDVS